ncbi:MULTISPECIES: type II toxin-antitoxin system VapC family toxin [unclassified Brevundimonas]|mgnify:CR=1 FL=1|uniref:type II toxin-antitoxin system VapC family toxin n=1 Tax=unclassified Brevundimonas TaxID=2622653 RepID=UPI000C3B49AF|nr:MULTISPECIES: type II toxin-antitoxin system VapC family toxin [unclassified Brevundimonas]MAL88950.1 VapC toxin family PIN domain ribonuclease [Brevundimonas sp.]
MTLYLLDTNAISDLIRDPGGEVAGRFALVGLEQVCTSVIVAAELRYGAAKRGSTRLGQRVDTVLRQVPIKPFEPPADQIYGHIRADLEAQGASVGDHDLLIAAQALSLGCILVTDNEREFRRVPGLPVENWRTAPAA